MHLRHYFSDSVDRKLEFLVDELARYGIAVAGIQETKWFWLDVWSAAKGYILVDQLLKLMLVWSLEVKALAW